MTSPATAPASTFLHNAWYIAAFAGELDTGFLARRILNEPILLYRTSDGAIAALTDFCPHRLVPLSIGKRVGDTIQCGYHGTVVGADGRCVAIPGQTHIPANAATHTYPARERYGLIWLWMGDAALADDALVPDLFWLEDPRWTAATGYIHMQADYRLVTDNLLDLSHESYIHLTSLGNREEETIAGFPAKITVEKGRSVHARRDMDGIEPPPAWEAAARNAGFPGRIDRLQIASYQPPGLNMTEAGYRAQGVGDYTTFGRVLHLLTPETATSTHYFFALARDYDIDDLALTAAVSAGTLATFTEDKFVLELQQQALLERGTDEVPQMVIALDAASIQGRRLLSAALTREREDPAAVLVPVPIVPAMPYHEAGTRETSLVRMGT